jgi:tripartite-type tricarboxylate transporter receptor subunit TctC
MKILLRHVPIFILSFAASPLLLIVHPSLPAKSVNELIALAKKRPGEIAHDSSGNGTIVHLAAEMLKSMADIKMALVLLPEFSLRAVWRPRIS